MASQDGHVAGVEVAAFDVGMVRTLIAPTATLAVVLLTAGCGLGPATPSLAEAESPPPPRRLMEDASVEPRGSKEPPLYPLREPTEEERKVALLLLLLGGQPRIR